MLLVSSRCCYPHRLTFVGLVLICLTLTPTSQSFAPTHTHGHAGTVFPPAPMISPWQLPSSARARTTSCMTVNGESEELFQDYGSNRTSTIDSKDNDEQEKDWKPPRQSVLYYDRSSQIAAQKRLEKEKACRDRKIAVYHNVLQKNANDCSVCTVPDKIDASKIVSPKENQANGVTPTPTLERSMRDIQRQVNALIQQPSVELADAFLILMSSFLVALSTVSSIPPDVMSSIYWLQDATLFLFTFGFFARWRSSLEPKGTYYDDPLEWVDLAVVVMPFLFLTIPGLANLFPSWVTSQTSLINLRLLRVLRFQRILQNEMSFSKFVSGIWLPGERRSKRDVLSCIIVESWELQLARVLLSIFTLLSVSTGLIYAAEHGVNPGIDNYFSALYFGLTTLTTVGFGDVTAITWQGKLVVSGSILAGVAIIPAQAAALVEALLERDADGDNPPVRPTSIPSTPASISSNLVLETNQRCPICKAGLHWTKANYCYNCGAKLDLRE